MRQGVHILKCQNLEDLASDESYKVAYILGMNKIKALPPVQCSGRYVWSEAWWVARTSADKSA